MKKFYEFKDFIEYIKEYKKNTRELEHLITDLGIARSELKEVKHELNIVLEQKDGYLETIKEKNKQIRQLKKEIKEMEK